MRAAEFFVVGCLAVGAGRAWAADPAQGRILYETYCGTCHYEKVHNRTATKVDSYAALKDQVAKWAAQTPRRFTPQEVDDVTEYLNRSHYRIAR